VRRTLSFLLYPLFTLWLVIPWIRRRRRHPRWWMVRLAGALVGIVLLTGGPALQVLGGSLVMLAALLVPVPDPDRVRRIAEALGAPHSLNGGYFREGGLPVPRGTPLVFLLSAEELLVAPEDRPDYVLGRFPLAGIQRILVDGEEYRPRYISFAKEPPRRDPQADRRAKTRLALALPEAALEVEFRGVFARHLAEVAAHTLHDLKRTRPALPVING
jgi:hypothetical protein